MQTVTATPKHQPPTSDTAHRIAALNRHAMMDPGRMSSKPETHHG